MIRHGTTLVLLASLAGPLPGIAQESVPTPAEAAPLATRQELLAIAQQYEDEVARVESEQGPLAARLGEQLQSQGRVYQQLDDHARAVESLKRAFHIKRVNDGLQDMDQVPVLQNIIESNIALRDWPAVDQNFEQLLWIYRRNHDDGDPALLDIYQQVGSWKIQAYRDGLLRDKGYETISDAAYLYTKTISLTEKKHGETDPRLVPLLYGHALTSYHAMIEFANRPLEEYADRHTSEMMRVPVVTYTTQCIQVIRPGGAIGTQCRAIPVTTYTTMPSRTGAYLRGQNQKDMDVERRFFAARKSLERIIAIHDAHPETPAKDRAEALAHLGDWYVLRGSNDKAAATYQQAWQTLQGTADAERLTKAMFGQPLSLPALRMGLPSIDKQLAPEHAAKFLTVTYDVTKTGRVQNTRISDSPEGAGASTRRQALDSLRNTKFRPRFENGVAVDTLGATKRFPVN